MNVRSNLRKRSLEQISSGGKRAKVATAVAKRRSATLDSRVRRILRAASETKELNNYLSGVNAAGGYISCINQVGEGDDDYQRNGRNIQPKAVVIDYYITLLSANIEDTGFVALIWDKQPNGGAATFANIYDTSAASPGLALRNTSSFKDRFVVLWMEPFVRQNNQSTAFGNFQNIRNRKYYSFPDNWRCEYGATAASVPTTGAVYIVMGSNNNSGTGTSATLVANCRFTFNDY